MEMKRMTQTFEEYIGRYKEQRVSGKTKEQAASDVLELMAFGDN